VGRTAENLFLSLMTYGRCFTSASRLPHCPGSRRAVSIASPSLGARQRCSGAAALSSGCDPAAAWWQEELATRRATAMVAPEPPISGRPKPARERTRRTAVRDPTLSTLGYSGVRSIEQPY